ncbi:pilus assembly protein [Chlorobaculum thiosulfatiphilum]|uniref:Pilus assembly protein n=1 Tax=Chlorobaculum thiosulfatiphilum TaxID=115852 RepID=A0A5C4S493_CHLTI|nr:pilus assembly protein [Chlorobaculum thiosulfatiphilum]
MITMHADAAGHQAPTAKPVRRQKGNAMVEFAFILPVFLLLLFGVIYFSVALYNKTVLAIATREGARAIGVRARNVHRWLQNKQRQHRRHAGVPEQARFVWRRNVGFDHFEHFGRHSHRAGQRRL